METPTTYSHSYGVDQIDTHPLLTEVENPKRRFSAKAFARRWGLDAKIIRLFIHSAVDLCWGIALAIFSTRIVPIDWVISQWASKRPTVVAIIITVLATLSTSHIKYTFQETTRMYSKAKVVDGFTLKRLKSLQGIMEWRIFAFPGIYNVLWLLIYVPMSLHSASIVAILQPVDFGVPEYYDDPIPCPIDYANLSFSFNTTPFLTARQEFSIDIAARSIGRQWGSYYDYLKANITTFAGGRLYLKEKFAYATVGDILSGIQDVPGVEFDASCARARANSSTVQIPPSEWTKIFPGRLVPTVQVSNGTVLISDRLPISNSSVHSNSTLQSINSTTIPDVPTVHTAFYSLISVDGSGGLMVADANGTVDVCTWIASPRLVHVQSYDTISHAASVEPCSKYPPYLGRGILQTVQGLGEAIASGATLDPAEFNRDLWGHRVVNNTLPPLPTVLQVLLADGTKGFLTAFVGEFIPYSLNVTLPDGLNICHSKNGNVWIHWSFGNNNNLGYIAIVLTTATGLVCTILVTRRLARKPRAKETYPLDIATSFLLGVRTGRHAALQGNVDDNLPLQLRRDPQGDYVIEKTNLVWERKDIPHITA